MCVCVCFSTWCLTLELQHLSSMPKLLKEGMSGFRLGVLIRCSGVIDPLKRDRERETERVSRWKSSMRNKTRSFFTFLLTSLSNELWMSCEQNYVTSFFRTAHLSRMSQRPQQQQNFKIIYVTAMQALSWGFFSSCHHAHFSTLWLVSVSAQRSGLNSGRIPYL